ncbi:hypothetical protein ACVW2L_001717 [Mucilaginibacter sp. HD30]
MMKKLILLCLITFTTALIALAQNKTSAGKVSGKLLDQKGEPAPFATVMLLKAQDSTMVKSALSDDSGNFVFDQLSDNEYIISITYMGYQKYVSVKFMISGDHPSVPLPAISLIPQSKSLQGVTIVAAKPLIEMQADKMVMNIQSSIAATGNTVFELLQKAPGVAIDQNDNIMLNGKSGITIYMDGKPTYMSQSDLTNLLKNMRSDQIAQLEIIANPSARYDAAGKAIINIVSIKNKSFGTNGSINTGGGLNFAPTIPIAETKGGFDYKRLGNFPRYNASLSLNNRKGKVNLFGNATFSNTQSSNNSISSRITNNTLYDQYTYRLNASHNLNYKAGADYFINKNTTIGVLVSGNDGHFENPEPSNMNGYIKTTNGTLQSELRTISKIEYKWANTTINANFKHTFDTTGRELSVDLDRSFYNNHGMEHGMVTRFYSANGVENDVPLNITNDIPNVYSITAGRAYYTIPMAEHKAKLEIGAKSSWVRSDNDFKYFKNQQVDVGRTNHFVYTENINALYGSFNKEFSPHWSLQAGLRMEYTKTDGNSLTIDQKTEREYFNLFPSIFVKQIIDKNNELSYSYSRRIDRPAYNKLNPFVYFSDPYNYEIGNEKLQPSFTNSFGINYTYKRTIITSLGYSSTNNFMAELYKNAVDDPAAYEKIKASTVGTNIDPAKITFLTTENLASSKVLNLGVTFPVNLTSWWTANNNFTVLYVSYKGKVANSFLDYEVVPYNFYSSQVFKLPRKISLEASVHYNSKNIYGQIKVKEQYAVNFGIRKSLWDGKANLSITANDIFATNRFYGTVNTTGVNSTSSNKSNSRLVAVNLSYKFGNNNVKSARSRSTATEDERNRVKIGN